jgi:hypothetical protein
MRRAITAVLVALGLMFSFMYSTAVAAPPQASYTAVFTEQSCELDVVAGWKNAKIDQVNAIFFQDGTAFENHLFTMQAPSTAPNPGIIKGRTARFHSGALPTTVESHTFYVLVQFYSGGAHQHEIWLQLSATCSR